MEQLVKNDGTNILITLIFPCLIIVYTVELMMITFASLKSWLDLKIPHRMNSRVNVSVIKTRNFLRCLSLANIKM